ncbi:MAG: porin, partial [Minicystis sp.]
PPAVTVAADAPPLPPPPGGPVAAPEPPPPLPSSFPMDGSSRAAEGPGFAGWHGAFFIRDPKDYLRIYPKLRINLDFNGYFGAGVSQVTAVDGGTALKPRFFLRRLEPELGGEFLKRWTFNGGFEITQPLSNANGKSENSAAGVGKEPTAGTASFAPVEATTAGIQAADVWIGYSIAPFLNFMLGQSNAPFSLENRTSNKFTPFMERNIAIRGFARTSNKEIGVTIWGELFDKMLGYEIGVFGGDGQNRPQVDANADFMGRVYVRPLLTSMKGSLAKLQIGLSASHGDRDPAYVGYDYTGVTSGQGFALWSPNYKDSLGRGMHVLASGAQNAIGGELRVPFSIFELRSEAYFVSNNTREAVDGYQLTNTERLGNVHGTAWYAMLSMWPLGDTFVSGDPGMTRPTKIDLSKEPDRPRKGVEVLALVAGIDGSYDGASRGGAYDGKTPGNPSGKIAKNIKVYQYGFGLNYWHTPYVRTTINYTIYHTPDSGTTDNLARVPGNTLAKPIAEAHLLHELGARFGVAF